MAMQLGPRAKVVAFILVLAAVATYLVIVDLGIHAGRVHRGVSVAGYDVGALSFPELVEELEARRDVLMERTFVFTADGVTDEVTPADVGWSPQPFDTARTVFDVGRDGLTTSAGERVRAWLGGIDVDWAGGVRSNRVGRLIARWRRAGLAVDEKAVRDLIRDIVGRGGPTRLQIPLLD